MVLAPLQETGLERQMRHDPALLACQRPMTILVWDVVGSCTLLSSMKLEAYRDLMRAAQSAAAAAIEAEGGFVARTMGDAVLAYFGFPFTGADDAEQAVRAAQAMPRRWRHGGVAMRARIAIASGLVIIDTAIGGRPSLEMPAFGQAPNLAARLTGVAAPGGIVVDDTTRLLVGERFAFEVLRGLRLKGLPHVTRAWRLLNPVPCEAVAHLEAAACQLPSFPALPSMNA
jgi:class 3 adenylate cyclase